MLAQNARAVGGLRHRAAQQAHPRRFGIASHLGVLLDCPTIGCAKSLLVGDADEPKNQPGATSQLTHKGDLIGMALRTRVGTQPIFVSTGHRVSLPTAVKFALSVTDGYRVPKPTREADRFVANVKKMALKRRTK